MKNDIIRVFVRRTSMTPNDDMAFIGDPPLIRPEAKEVHISVVFTWDLPKAYRLQQAWSQYYPIVKIGGVPLTKDIGSSEPGMYVKPNVIFTSRGCNNKCDFCLVPVYEGKFRAVKFEYTKNPIIQDNNLLQHEPTKLGLILNRLRDCGTITFSGGLDSRLITARTAYMLRQLKIKQLFLACDRDSDLPALEKAVKLLDINQNKLRCYVLIGRESISDAKARLKRVWEIGCIPFAQLYQSPDRLIKYPKEWKDLQRNWSRPAITKSL